MLGALTKRGWRNHIASLRRRAETGEVLAMTDLGLNLLEGIQDRNGRSIVRRNPRAAVLWFRQAADRGDHTAASSLGYAYDVGLGTRRNVAHAVRWYRRAARSGDSGAMSNLATVYRDAGKAGLAFRWWKRAADLHDGDAALDIATAINTESAQGRIPCTRSACSDTRSHPEIFPNTAAKRLCTTSLFN
jgi:TPR repeat protein